MFVAMSKQESSSALAPFEATTLQSAVASG